MIGRNSTSAATQTAPPAPETLFERLGGRECLERVHKRLYDRIFHHPVLGAFFADKNRQHQEDQQTDFMTAQFGGPKRYGGRFPGDAHQHMFITEEHFDLRYKILEDVLIQCEIAPELRESWLIFDRKFKNQIVKKSVDECVKRYKNDTILVAPR